MQKIPRQSTSSEALNESSDEKEDDEDATNDQDANSEANLAALTADNMRTIPAKVLTVYSGR